MNTDNLNEILAWLRNSSQLQHLVGILGEALRGPQPVAWQAEWGDENGPGPHYPMPHGRRAGPWKPLTAHAMNRVLWRRPLYAVE